MYSRFSATFFILFSFVFNTGFLVAQKSEEENKPYSSIAQYDKEENRAFNESSKNPSVEDLFYKTTFLSIDSIVNDLVVTKILGHAPKEGSTRDFDDKRIREDVVAYASKKQIWKAAKAVDSIFDYSQVLGDKFNAHKLPKTVAFFQKVDADARIAIHGAKYYFQRPRPLHNSGYSYPSGHSTRAFLWESLLSDIFPNAQPKLYQQAQCKAWDRVILGRHYPADISAGQTYGEYLAKEFLKDPEFLKEWNEVRKEIKKEFASRE